ncbi:metallophosphoesterase [Niallia sp. XMNu-256]|uniref:metallophosphoesterase n=1 Tax=Niallia sp. XMNu-256 TaxID=3082444 RepID=UPI0030CE82E2
MKKPLVRAYKRLSATALALSVLVAPLPYQTVLAANSEQTGTPDLSLRILGTTDIHTHLYNYDYYEDAEIQKVGLAKTATLIKEARAEAKNTLLFDNGDLIEGNPLGEYVAKVDKLEEGELHPVFQAMKKLDYDAATVGNHEFNFGLEFLDEVLDDAPMPYVNANVYKVDHDNDPSNDKHYFKPYTILKKKVVDDSGHSHVIKVGVVGAVTPQITEWDEKHLAGKVITKDIVKSVQAQIPKMKDEGADLIIVLAHTGIGDAEVKEFEELAAYDLTKVDGIDAIIAGHTHTTFPGNDGNLPGVDAEKGTINGVPVVLPGFYGSHLGVIDLKLAQEKGNWVVKHSEVDLRAIYDEKENKSLAQPDKEVLKAVKEAHDNTRTFVKSTIWLPSRFLPQGGYNLIWPFVELFSQKRQEGS